MFENIVTFKDQSAGIVSTFQENNAQLERVLAAMKALSSLEVLVGIPEAESSRPPDDNGKGGTGINNAELLYIHSNGSPLKGIPPRPSIEPAIIDDKETLSAFLAEASQKAMNGDMDGMKRALEKAGMLGEQAARGWFTNAKNGWAPNADITINGTEAYVKKINGKKVKVKFIKGKKSSRPLIDTGEMRRSITYVVRKKGST